MFDELTGVLAYWGFLSFCELDSAFGGCIPLGSIDPGLLFFPMSCLVIFHVICFSLCFYCCIAWELGRSFTSSIFFLPWQDCIPGHCPACILILPSVGVHAALLFFLTICVIHLHLHTLVAIYVPVKSLFMLDYYYFLFFYPSPVQPWVTDHPPYWVYGFPRRLRSLI